MYINIPRRILKLLFTFSLVAFAFISVRLACMESSLYDAIEDNNLESIIGLLKHGANPNELREPPHTRTPLLVATISGKENIVGTLLAHGADPNIADRSGCTPLHKAAKYGHVHIVELLLKHRAHVDRQDVEGFSPLFFAVESNNVHVARLLLAGGATVNKATEISSLITALGFAAMIGNVEMVELLLANGADVTAVNEIGQLPLNIAADSRHWKIVEMLLAETTRRATNIVSVLQEALNSAVREGNLVWIERLARCAGVNINTPEPFGQTALFIAANVHADVAVVNTLLRLGAQPSLPSRNGITPLEAAMFKGHEGSVRQLLAYGATLSDEFMKNKATLINKVKDYCPKAGRLLLGHALAVFKASADFCTYIKSDAATTQGVRELLAKRLTYGFAVTANVRDEHGRTPLHYATERARSAEGKNDDWARIAHILVARHADVNARDVHGNTPLHHALCNRNEVLASLLIRYGADVSASNDCGTPALMMWSAFARHIVMSLAGHHGAAAMAGGTLGRS